MYICGQTMETKKHTVLIIDDVSSIRLQLANHLVQQNFIALKAEDAQAGLEILNSRPDIELIFLDLRLPDLPPGSLDLAKKISEKWPKIPVIIISGYLSKEILVRLKSIGIEHFIAKPFKNEEVIEKTKKILPPS